MSAPDDDDGFQAALTKDVDELVKVANLHRCSETCYKYRKKNVEVQLLHNNELIDSKMIKITFCPSSKPCLTGVVTVAVVLDLVTLVIGNCKV